MPKKANLDLNREMSELRQGDLVTNLDCGQECADHVVTVLSREGGYLQLSLPGVVPWPLVDKNGPYCWDGQAGHFLSKEGHVFHHIGPMSRAISAPTAGVQAAGIYRSLPHPDEARFYISPKNLTADLGETILMQMEAMLQRSEDGPSTSLQTMSQLLDMIFADNLSALDTRRTRLLLVLLACVKKQAVRASKKNSGLKFMIDGTEVVLTGGMPPGLAEVLKRGGFASSDGSVNLDELMNSMGLGDRPPRGH